MTNEKTKWLFDEENGKSGKPDWSNSSELTESLGPPGAEPTYGGSSDPTVQMSIGGTREEAPEKTHIYSQAGRDEAAPATFGSETDPVVGWLVVVRGPGLGNAVALGAGMNTIGRGSGARVSLPFGDNLISGEDHLRIIYDDAERAFHIAHGSGKNISRVNGQLLANTLPLENDALIEISRATHLRFKPFCGADFDWSDLDTAGAETT